MKKLSKGKAIWSKIKLTLKVIMGLVLFGLIAIHIWMLFTVDGPAEREQNAIRFWEQEANNIQPYMEYFTKYKDIFLVLRDKKEYHIVYVKDRKEILQYGRLILNFEADEYYISSTDRHFTSVNEALEFIEMEPDDFELWRSFLEKYNLYSIGFGHVSRRRYVRIVFNRFHIVPHGLIYVPIELEDNFRSLKRQVPGRSRDKSKGGSYDILTHLEGRWFYFEIWG